MLASREELLGLLPSNAVVAEIGVADGDFSSAILRIARPSKLYLVDAWDSDRYRSGREKVQARFVGERAVEIRQGLSTDVLPTIPEHSLDWLYLDTVHDYETTAQELEFCRRAVKPSGRICGHDFCIGNPYLSLPYGVIRAVYEFADRHRWAIEYVALDSDGYFSFCLRPCWRD